MPVPSVSDVLSIPTRAGGITNAANGIAEYFAKQHAAVQGLQLQQAQDLSKFKTLDQIYYGGAHSQMIDQALSQNPYGRHIASMGQALSGQQSQQPIDNMMGNPAAGASMIGLNTGNQFTGNSVLPNALGPMGDGGGKTAQPGGNVVTGGSMTQKAFEPPSFTQSVANPQGEAAVSQAKAEGSSSVEIPAGYAKEIMTGKAKSAQAASTLEGITRNLVADLKSSMVESGGGGPIGGNIANLSTHFGMSPATYGLKNTARDSAIAYARDLAGGSQGVTRIFQAVAETIPGANATPQQAGTAALQMHLTARQLESGMQNLGLKPKDMKDMSDEEVQKVLNSGTIDRDTETKAFANIVNNIEPTKVMDLQGNLGEPQPNPISKAMGWKYDPNSFNPVSNAGKKQNEIPKYDSKTQKLQQNKKTGEYRVVSING